jgi:hypothetical protein
MARITRIEDKVVNVDAIEYLVPYPDNTGKQRVNVFFHSGKAVIFNLSVDQFLELLDAPIGVPKVDYTGL